MIKKFKHIYNYLTSPTYRFFSDFFARQKALDRQMNGIIDNQKLTISIKFINKDKNKKYE